MPRPPKFVFAAGPPKASKALADCASNLEILASSMTMIPIIGQQIAGAIQTVQKICERAQHIRETKKELQELVLYAVDILVNLMNSWETMDLLRHEEMRSAVEVFMLCLQGVLDAAEQISRPPLLTKLMEPLRPNSLAATVGKLNECLDKAVLSFQLELQECVQRWEPRW